jgi:hypothetical protein
VRSLVSWQGFAVRLLFGRAIRYPESPCCAMAAIFSRSIHTWKQVEYREQGQGFSLSLPPYRNDATCEIVFQCLPAMRSEGRDALKAVKQGPEARRVDLIIHE